MPLRTLPSLDAAALAGPAAAALPGPLETWGAAAAVHATPGPSAAPSSPGPAGPFTASAFAGGVSLAQLGPGPVAQASVALGLDAQTNSAPEWLLSAGQSGQRKVAAAGVQTPGVAPDQPQSHNGSGTAVIIIDTGYNTAWGTDGIVYGQDFSGTGDADARDPQHGSHGSWVQEVVQAVAGGVDIIHLKVFADYSSGAYLSDIEEALDWAVSNAEAYGVVAVNMSLGYGNTTTATTTQLSDEIAELSAKGVFTLVAAGNSGASYRTGVNVMAADPNVIGVSASDSSGAFTSWSQKHSQFTDITALGANITMTDDFGASSTVSGTSFSTPLVSGIAAVLQDAAMDVLGRRLTQSEFVDILQRSGRSVTNGAEFLDTAAARTGGSAEINEARGVIPVRDPGHSLASAYDLGAPTGPVSILETMGRGDRADVYQVWVHEAGTLTVDLDAAFRRPSLRLYDGEGNRIIAAASIRQNVLSFEVEADQGTYFVAVAGRGRPTAYELELGLPERDPTPIDPEPDPAPDPAPDPTPPDDSLPAGYRIADVDQALAWFLANSGDYA